METHPFCAALWGERLVSVSLVGVCGCSTCAGGKDASPRTITPVSAARLRSKPYRAGRRKPSRAEKRSISEVLMVDLATRTTAVATQSFGGRDRRSVVANGAKADDALFAVCRVLRPSQGRLSGFTTEKF